MNDSIKVNKEKVIEDLWKKYLKDRDKITRDKLVVEYSDIVKYIALRFSNGLPDHIELDDLISVGIIGLIKAIENFSEKYDNKFETYATFKIKGAILDYLRELDWVSRNDRQKIKKISKAYQELEAKLGRTPYDEEVAEYLEISYDEFKEWSSTIAPVVFSIDTPVKTNKGDEASIEEIIEDKNSDNPLELLEKEEVKKAIKEAINELSEKEKIIIALYHYEELNLKEIGKVLNVSESRISQLHNKALLKLKAKVRNKLNKKIEEKRK